MIDCFLLDENLPVWWRKALAVLAPGIKIHCVGAPAAPPKKTSDPVILDWCEKQSSYLITDNRRTMFGHLQEHVAVGRHVPGIFVVDKLFPIHALADQILLIAGASLKDEHIDQIKYLPHT